MTRFCIRRACTTVSIVAMPNERSTDNCGILRVDVHDPACARCSESGLAPLRRILVSSTRKPMSYINLAKRFLYEHGEVHFAALGVAISPMVTAAEILKHRRLATVTKITTSLESLPEDQRCANGNSHAHENSIGDPGAILCRPSVVMVSL